MVDWNKVDGIQLLALVAIPCGVILFSSLFGFFLPRIKCLWNKFLLFIRYKVSYKSEKGHVKEAINTSVSDSNHRQCSIYAMLVPENSSKFTKDMQELYSSTFANSSCIKAKKVKLRRI